MMSQNHDTGNPFLNFIVTVLVYISSAVVVNAPLVSDLHIPPIVMELGQIAAWCFMGGTFLIGMLNYFNNKTKKEKGEMKLITFLLQRKIYNVDKARNIISDMFADEKWLCYVLEDEIRADGVKVHGETCIPAGEYDVMLTFSNRFKRVMPLIYNQPDLTIEANGKKFSGVRFHGGNTEKDSHGCPLTAYNVNAEQTRIFGSAETDITRLIKSNGGKAKLIIEDRGLTGGGLNKKMAL